jgi:hypothetical protein
MHEGVAKERLGSHGAPMSGGGAGHKALEGDGANREIVQEVTGITA